MDCCNFHKLVYLQTFFFKSVKHHFPYQVIYLLIYFHLFVVGV